MPCRPVFAPALLVPCALLLAAVVLVPGCARVKPLTEVVAIVREERTDSLLAGVEVRFLSRIHDRAPWRASDPLPTNALGAAGFKIPRTDRRRMREEDLFRLVVRDPFQPGAPTDTLRLNGYLRVIDIAYPDPRIAVDTFRVADMHYHISMRAQNRFGQDMHEGVRPTGAPGHPPRDINWFRSDNALKAYVNGRPKKVKRDTWARLQRAAAHPGDRSYRRYRALLTGRVVPAEANNKLNHYTQATHPHAREGHVRLGYNAISPFETNLFRTPQQRIVGSVAKSGATRRWLLRIGGNGIVEPRLSHWENFRLEYDLMARQDPAVQHAQWCTIDDGRDVALAADSTLLIVNVIEGGHAIQDKVFPCETTFDLSDRTAKENDELRKHWFALLEDPATDAATLAVLRPIAHLRDAYQRIEQQISDTSGLLGIMHLNVVDSLVTERRKVEHELFENVDAVLDDDICNNVRRLKALYPPVHMMTVSHLSYNGMLGHAPALDDGTAIGKLTARRVYAIRVSEDPQYLKQWKGLFFTVPGPNRFGKTLLNELLATYNGHRILVDLKHSDPMVRRYFYDSLMSRYDVPPICSHCALNGMSLDEWSPFNDEFALLRAPTATTFYPFGINLFDEEVLYIHRNHGIIGLPLEHRVLGGYLNKPVVPDLQLCRNGTPAKKPDRQRSVRRFDQIERLLKWLAQDPQNAHLLDAAQATSRMRYDAQGDRTLECTIRDYMSVEPILQNLFRAIDLIRADAAYLPQGAGPDAVLAYPWHHVCFGSDLDGLIDPVDLCPTAGQYPLLRERMEQFIPVFLHFRYREAMQRITSGERPPAVYADYFRPDGSGGFTLDQALYWLFYGSLSDFTFTYMRR